MSGVYRPASIHPSAFVAPGAIVLGDVTLGPRSSVWFNTVIRGDSAAVVVGEDTNIQDNSVVHQDEGLPALLGARVTVGHRTIVHGCVIEDDCLIGMGSVILSGAQIGRGSLIGAASLVREGQIVPPGSLVVGSPARVVGPVGPRHQEAIAQGAAHYAELARFYALRGLARSADPAGTVARDLGPMSRREWHELVRMLEAGPAWAAALGQGESAPAALLIAEAAEVDREVRLPLVDEVTRGDEPLMPEVRAGTTEVEMEWRAAVERWREARQALCARLDSLGPEAWPMLAGHPTRGPRSLADLVREWVEMDLELRRRISARREVVP